MLIFFFIIFVVTLIAFIKLYYDDPNKNKATGTKRKKYEWITLGVTILSLLFSLIGLNNTSNNIPNRPSHHKSKEALAYLNINGKRANTDDYDNSDSNSINKSFDNNDNIQMNAHVRKGTHVYFEDGTSNDNLHKYYGDTIHKISPTNYQITIHYTPKEENDLGVDGYNETIGANQDHHRTSYIKINANDTKIQKTEFNQMKNNKKQQSEQKKQQNKAKSEQKWAKYTTLDTSSLANMSYDQLVDQEHFIVSGRVVSMGSTDDGQSQALLDVPNSDRYFLLTVSGKTAIKHHIATRDHIIIYGSNIGGQDHVTMDMVQNGISSSYYGEDYYDVLTPKKIVNNTP